VNPDALLAALAAADPARAAEAPRADAPAARALKRTILAEPIRTRRRPRAWLAAALVAAAAIAAASLTRALEADPVGVQPAAAAVLERTAAVAARTVHVTVGRYSYTRTRAIWSITDTDDPPFTALVPAVQETWLAVDGAARVRTVRGEAYFPSARDRGRWVAHGSPPLGVASGSVSIESTPSSPVEAAALAKRDPATLDARELDELLNAPNALPTDTDRLEGLLRAYALTKDPPLESMMFNQLEDLLTNPFDSAALRAAAYRVLARMSGVQLRGPVRDPAGRKGIAIDFPAGYVAGERNRLIFDPRTGDVLTVQTLLDQPNDEVAGEPGTVIAEVVYLSSGWVDRVGSRPAARR
jgi:hypothetical protein